MEGGDDEFEDSDCLPRLLEELETYKVSTLYRYTLLTRHGIYSRAEFISLSASNCAAFIQGRRLFGEIR